MKNTSEINVLSVRGVVEAGFPTSPSEELVDTMSLDEYLIENKEATYLLKVSGDSMKDQGILPDDTLIIERGCKPKHGDIVIVEMAGEYLMKNFPLKLKEECVVVAVVKGVFRKYR